jgi:hypothetical protein
VNLWPSVRLGLADGHEQIFIGSTFHNIRSANGGYHCFLAIRSGAQRKGRLLPSFPSHQLLASSLNILRIHSITTRAAGSRFRWFCMRSHTARRCGRRVTLRPRSALSGPQACSGNIPMAACDWISPRITRRLSVMHRVRALRPWAFRNLDSAVSSRSSGYPQMTGSPSAFIGSFGSNKYRRTSASLSRCPRACGVNSRPEGLAYRCCVQGSSALKS